MVLCSSTTVSSLVDIVIRMVNERNFKTKIEHCLTRKTLFVT